MLNAQLHDAFVCNESHLQTIIILHMQVSMTLTEDLEEQSSRRSMRSAQHLGHI